MRIYITIDVECSLPSLSKGGDPEPVGTKKRVYGDVQGKQYGIHFIMDMLDKHGFKGTFFCDSCMTYLVGESETGKVLRDITSRDHDVQLHVHPIYRLWASTATRILLPREQWSDHMGKLPTWLQADLIKEGRDLLKKHTGREPTAFRAGNYGASAATLELLASHGFLIDSSYNLWAQTNAGYGQTLRTEEPVNAPFKMNGILEFPVTCFVTAERWPRAYRFFAPEGASFTEMCMALMRLRAAGVEDAVVVLHSFSFLKADDPHYRSVKFNAIAYRRFRRLLQYLAARKDDYQVLSFSDYLRQGHKPEHSAVTPRHFVRVPIWAVGLRIAGQLIQRYI